MHNYKWNNLANAIDGVKGDSDKLQNKIHAIAISILAGWAQDAKRGPEAAQYMTNLVNNAPWHGASLAVWVGIFSTMQYSKDNECYFVQEGQKFKKDNLDAAKAKPFWVVKPPKKPKAFNIWDALGKEIEKADRHLKKPVDGDVVDQGVINKLRELYAQRPVQ